MDQPIQGIARRIRRARIETCRLAFETARRPASPDEFVGRGLKHTHRTGHHHPAAGIARRIRRARIETRTRPILPGSPTASPDEFVGRGLKRLSEKPLRKPENTSGRVGRAPTVQRDPQLCSQNRRLPGAQAPGRGRTANFPQCRSGARCFSSSSSSLSSSALASEPARCRGISWRRTSRASALSPLW